MMNSATIAYLVDNGSYLSFASSIDSVIDPTEREKAIAVLKEGGVVVSDPSVIDNGKTTLHHSIDIDGKVEKHTLTVQAVAYPLPINLTGAVMMSPQVADELGVDVQLVGRAIQADDWWINGKRASEYNESGIHLPGVYVAQISAAEVGSYVMSWSFTGIITLFVIVMLVLLSGLETRSSLKLYNSVGAHPNLRRRFSAWYAFLTALYGSIGGIICGFLVMGLFKVASWVSYYVHDGQTFSPVENTGITVLIIVTLGLVVITPLVAAVVGALLAPKADPVRINH